MHKSLDVPVGRYHKPLVLVLLLGHLGCRIFSMARLHEAMGTDVDNIGRRVRVGVRVADCSKSSGERVDETSGTS